MQHLEIPQATDDLPVVFYELASPIEPLLPLF
jgi:hypothetical protein